MSTGVAVIGTSGWSYRHWRVRFYPPDLTQGKWLGYYTEHFPTVELNSSFYHEPKPTTYDGWRKRTPADFVFAVKMNRFITHRRRLAEVEGSTERFLTGARRLGEKLGPVLVQLPPPLERDDDLLARFLGLVRGCEAGRDLRYTIEFRNSSWLTDEVYRALEEANCALCWNDYGRVGISDVPTAEFIYIRRHGAGRRYTGCYSDEALTQDAGLVVRHLGQGRDVFVYFNNDAEGLAVRNARTLAALLKKETDGSP